MDAQSAALAASSVAARMHCAREIRFSHAHRRDATFMRSGAVSDAEAAYCVNCVHVRAGSSAFTPPCRTASAASICAPL